MSTKAIDASIRVHIDISILNKSEDFRAVVEHRKSAAAEAKSCQRLQAPRMFIVFQGYNNITLKFPVRDDMGITKTSVVLFPVSNNDYIVHDSKNARKQSDV